MAQFRDELQTASRQLSVEKFSLSASAEFVPAIGFREATLAAAAKQPAPDKLAAAGSAPAVSMSPADRALLKIFGSVPDLFRPIR